MCTEPFVFEGVTIAAGAHGPTRRTVLAARLPSFFVEDAALLDRFMTRFFLAALLALAALNLTSQAFAQEKTAEETVQALADPFRRETPRSSVTGLLEALAQRDYTRAANYMDTTLPAGTRNPATPQELARRLQVLLDNGGSLQAFGTLSNDAVGRAEDALAADREEVGRIKIGDAESPVLLSRAEVDGRQVWRVAPETIGVLATTRVEAAVAQNDGVMFAGAPLKDWALLVGAAIMSFGGLYLIAGLALLIGRRLVPHPETHSVYRFLQAALPPGALVLAVALFYGWADELSVSIVARQAMLRYTAIFAVLAVVWFALRLVDAISDIAIHRMKKRQQRQVVSVITLMRRAAKILLLAFSAVGILDTFGINVTTGIAALGVGGIALALGAQKTVENLVGSVTFIADRPAQIGDFVKVGDVVGTIEDIGIRSTRIRTNDRTLVTIPNGDLSARQVENYAVRERFLFNPVIGVEYSLSAAKLREAIGIVQDVLTQHPDIAEGGRARLSKLGESSVDIEVYSYIDTADGNRFVVAREELLLSIYERFEAAGIGFAFPTRTLTFAESSPLYARTVAAEGEASPSTAAASREAAPTSIAPGEAAPASVPPNRAASTPPVQGGKGAN
jgi:MscS family membrane protein